MYSLTDCAAINPNHSFVKILVIKPALLLVFLLSLTNFKM